MLFLCHGPYNALTGRGPAGDALALGITPMDRMPVQVGLDCAWISESLCLDPLP